MNKPFKLFATVLVMALVAFLFSGCGGDDEEDTAPPPRSAGSNNQGGGNASASTTAAAAGAPSQMAEEMIGQAVVPTENTPEDFTEAIENERTVVVTFYMPSPTDDNQVRSSVMTLQGRYRGQVEFFSYLYSDSQSYKDLVNILNVNSTPTVVVINRDGVVQRAWTGYADEESIEQGIVEALAAN